MDDIDPRIENGQTEMKGITEKLIRYDTHFKARNPKLLTEHLLVRLHIEQEVYRMCGLGDIHLSKRNTGWA